MKKRALFFYVSLCVSWSLIADKQTAKSQRVLEDEIIALAHGSERSHIFCKSDTERRGIDSRTRKLDDLIFDELVYQDALRLKLPIDDSVVKDHLRRTVQMFGGKPGDESAIFAQEGYTYKEGFEQFRIMYAVNAMIDHRVRSGLLVTEEDVLKYYNENPEIKESKYLLQTAHIAIDKDKGIKKKGVEKDIDRYIKTGKGLEVAWSDPYWLKKSEIAQGLSFIMDMEPNTVVKSEHGNGFQLYKLNDKKAERTVPLKKRYKKIVEQLQRPKYEERLNNYKKSLIDQATVVYFS